MEFMKVARLQLLNKASQSFKGNIKTDFVSVL